jgi:hypothetical protein
VDQKIANAAGAHLGDCDFLRATFFFVSSVSDLPQPDGYVAATGSLKRRLQLVAKQHPRRPQKLT